MIITNTGDDFVPELEKHVPPRSHVNVVISYHNGTKQRGRLAWSRAEHLMVMSKGRRKYGYYPDWYEIDSVNFPEKRVSKDDKWRKSWEKVASRLEKSGLWTEVLEDVRTALDIGLEKLQKAYSIDNEFDSSVTYLTYEEKKKSQADRIQELDPRLVKTREDGSIYPNSSIIWYMYKSAKVKKMYFGKYANESCLSEIKNAFNSKRALLTMERAGYDVHFEYNPERNKAWYSEEYRGMGNGHYYLALDGTHALFYEDD